MRKAIYENRKFAESCSTTMAWWVLQAEKSVGVKSVPPDGRKFFFLRLSRENNQYCQRLPNIQAFG